MVAWPVPPPAVQRAKRDMRTFRNIPAGVDAGSRRPRRALGGIAAGVLAGLALVTGLAWWLWPAGEAAGPQAGARGFPWARAPMSPEPERSVTAPAAADAAAVPASGATAAAGPVVVDLCGLGQVVVPRAATEEPGAPLAQLPAPLGRHALEEAQRRLAQALSTGDARQRVVARLLLEPTDDDASVQAAWARALLADALASRDAQAMRWAGAACPFVEDEARCKRQLARARVQAEPANALHWLDWANDEPEAADAAWAGLLRARYWREQPLGQAAISMRALSAMGADVPGYLRATLAVDAMARDASYPAPPMALLLERCPSRQGSPGTARAAGVPAAPADCDRLARLLLEQSDSVQALMLGRELGEHVGWPAERVRRLDEEVEALQKQEAHWVVDARRPLACETVEGQASHIAAVERDGELAVLRRNLTAAPAAPR